MERAFKLTKFRNFGLKKPVKFVINHTLEPNKMGDLVILIGPNNSGKSNILDAMMSFANEELENRDITTLSYKEEDRRPVVSFCVRDKKVGWQYAKNISLDGIDYYMNDKDVKKDYTKQDLDKIKKDFNEIFDKHSAVLVKCGFTTSSNRLKEIVDKLEKIKNPTELKDFSKELYESDFCKSYRDELEKRGHPNRYYSSRMRPEVFDASDEIAKTKIYQDIEGEINENCEQIFKNKFGINLVPQIIKYEAKDIRESDLICSPDKIRNNSFYTSLFTEDEIKEIDHIYENYKTYQNMAIFSDLVDRFKFKTDEINKRFNKMYFMGKNNQYKFFFVFESTRIGFGIKHGNKTIYLSLQSDGFKWFFNFYFNFLNNTKFEPGDIVIMDEPATRLHPYGQFELRTFMKELAKKLCITFVIATHSPFLIDVNNYDELRIVSSSENESFIDNLFSAVNYNDPDTLLPIKDALTIKQSVLYDEGIKKIFVEGILDYNYLTLFKKIFRIDNLAFIPIQGIGRNSDERERILTKLIKINKSPTLLVDSDDAGLKAMKFGEGKNISIITIKEILPNCLEIEDLFTKQDQSKHKIDKEDKDAFRSSLLKNNATKKDFDDITIKNFEKLLKYLESI